MPADGFAGTHPLCNTCNAIAAEGALDLNFDVVAAALDRIPKPVTQQHLQHNLAESLELRVAEAINLARRRMDRAGLDGNTERAAVECLAADRDV